MTSSFIALAPALNFAQLNNSIFGTDPKAISIGGGTFDYTTPRGIISALLPYLFVFAGLILFVMLVWGGFEMLTGATDPKQQEAGKQRIIAALVGFFLIFSAYWLAQIVQTIFGISILG